jgi:hypothetical protein
MHNRNRDSVLRGYMERHYLGDKEDNFSTKMDLWERVTLRLVVEQGMWKEKYVVAFTV